MVKAMSLRGFAVAAAVSALFPLACSSSSTTTNPTTDGGHTSTSGKGSSNSSGSKNKGSSGSEGSSTSKGGSSSSKPIKDSGIEDAPKGHTDASGGDGGACAAAGDKATLYTRLGGHAGILTAVQGVVTAELMNADIKSYFFYQLTPNAPANGHPSATQVEECFAYFVGSALQGSGESYPVTLTASEGGPYTCRDLKLAHKDLQIDQATFATFISIAATSLTTQGVCAADLVILAPALEGTATDVVTDTKKADAAEPFPGSVDAALHIPGDAG